MSVHYVYKRDGGAKMMRPIHTREEYLSLRNGGEQQQLVRRIRNGEEKLKFQLVEMNYSCLPNEDGSLKGSKTMSTTVGMDIDHIPAEEMQAVRERILSKKDELGLLMLEMSARGQGYHLVFKRRPDLSQESSMTKGRRILRGCSSVRLVVPRIWCFLMMGSLRSLHALRLVEMTKGMLGLVEMTLPFLSSRIPPLTFRAKSRNLITTNASPRITTAWRSRTLLRSIGK